MLSRFKQKLLICPFTLWACDSRYMVWCSFCFLPLYAHWWWAVSSQYLSESCFPRYAQTKAKYRASWDATSDIRIQVYSVELFRIVAIQKTNTLLPLTHACCWIVYALWLLLLCILLFIVRNLNNGNLGVKSV